MRAFDGEQIIRDQLNKVVEILKAKNALQPCPRCGTDSFNVEDAYFVSILQKNPAALAIGGQSIPMAVLTCNNCGFVIQHAIGQLGLLEEFGKEWEANKLGVPW